MRQSLNRPRLVLVAATLLALTGTSLYGQGQSQNQATGSARSRADETLEWWNHIGNRLIAMAKDFLKTSTISRYRKTSAPLPKIFYTSLPSTSI